MRNGVYGIDKFLLQPAVANGFPESWETGGDNNVFALKAIVRDSLSFNDQPAQDNDIEVEDMDTAYATLPSSLPAKGFSVQTYDLSEEAYMYLMGYTKNDEGWMEETPNFQLDNQAVHVETKKIADFPAKIFEWANLSVKVSRTGTIGKGGFPNLNLEFKQVVLTDASGKEIAGARWMPKAQA